MNMAEANEKVHPVETQWHYPVLTKYGFTPLDKEQEGFVRSYRYQKGDGFITCTTGANADYWNVKKGPYPSGLLGYWADLELYLKEYYEISTEEV